MPYNPEIGRKMDAARDAAEQELIQGLKEMSPEEKAGAQKVASWMRMHYMKAGYKRLSKVLLQHL